MNAKKFDERVRALVAAADEAEPRPYDDSIIARAMAAPPPKLPGRVRWQLPAIGLGLAAAAAIVFFVVRPGATPASKTCHVGHATISDCATVARVDGSDTDISIVPPAGGIVFDVDHDVHRAFRVRTASFVVDVLGTQFEVRPRSVRVMRGVVRVTAPDGRVLAATLSAGETWSLDDPSPDIVAKGSGNGVGNGVGVGNGNGNGNSNSNSNGNGNGNGNGVGNGDGDNGNGDGNGNNGDGNGNNGDGNGVVGDGNGVGNGNGNGVGSSNGHMSGTSGSASKPTGRRPDGAVDDAAALTAARKVILSNPSEARVQFEKLIASKRLTRGQEADAKEGLAHTITDRAAQQRALEGVADEYRDLPMGEIALAAAVRLAPDPKPLMRRYLERYPAGSLASSYRSKLGVK